ncbi:phospholipase D-like domain-containing protein [Marinobacterium jannaschii]|uniref:phospholipase D-like domain-containing protein n=1 Tax=Marinobacterium jannaschii TaxID=64970 RepID=UPI0004874B78|nr:phospholipase D-like domain-containing protein [Marinobacterium jannaschii]
MRKRFPWRDGNHLKLMVDGEAFFPVMLEAVSQARHSLLLEFYLFASGQIADKFITELIAAARRGVMVKIILDGFGGLKFKDSDRIRLERAGVDLVVYNPLHLKKFTRNFARDHRKLLVVDQQVAFIGGTGISDVYWLSEGRGCPWHELMVRIQGPVVADLVDVYNALWARCTANRLPPGGGHAVAGDASVRVTTVQGMYQQDIKASFLNRVNHAENHIWLMTAYFLPSLSVRSALRKAARRGVEVRLLIAGPYTDQPWVFHASKRYYRSLLRAGVKIYEYQPRFLHAKMAVVDGWSSVGSCNLDHWNLRWNLEANIEVTDAEFIAQAVAVLQDDIQHCEAVTWDEWQKRPWHRKLKEMLWSWLSQLVLKIR